MSQGTDVIYNGVVLNNVVTRRWKQDLRYDPTKTHAVGHTYEMTFSGVVTAEYVTALAAEHGPWVGEAHGQVLRQRGSNAPAVYQAIRDLLLTPRRELQVTMGGTRVLVVEPCTSLARPNRDIDNGPKPTDVTIEHVASDKAFRITFSISATTIGCTLSSGRPVPFVLSNRWAVAETMDANLAMSRTIRGRMIFSSSEIPGHLYKELIVPTLEKSFRRDSVRFEVQEDGLAADYEVTDRQVDHAAPWPAQKMNVVHTQATHMGANFMSDIGIVLDGYPGAPRDALLQQALRIADARMNFLEKFKGDEPSAVPEQVALIEHFGDIPRIEVRMRIIEVPKPGKSFLDTIGHGIGEPLKLPALDGRRYDWQTSWEPSTYGHNSSGPRHPAVLMTLHAYFQNPCGGPKGISHQTEEQGKAGRDAHVSPEPTRVKEYVVPKLKDRRDQRYSREATTTVFTYSKVRSRYLTNKMRVQLPIADFSRNPQEATTTVATISRPQGQKIIMVDVERVGALPRLHPPHDLDTDGATSAALLDHWIEMMPPVLSNDGRTLIYRIRAYYRYALARPKAMQDSLHIGAHPYTDFDGRVSLRDVYGLR